MAGLKYHHGGGGQPVLRKYQCYACEDGEDVNKFNSARCWCCGRKWIGGKYVTLATSIQHDWFIRASHYAAQGMTDDD